MIIEGLSSVSEVVKLSDAQLKDVTVELTDCIVQTVKNNGGHLAPSLGAVHFITALCGVYDFSRDKIIFDVGHQAYAYKILNEGKTRFSGMRKEGGPSGFTGDNALSNDAFVGGHAGNSLAYALGACHARDALNEDYTVVAVIGDGSFFNGENLEALFVSEKKPKNLVVIFNDNGMSISPNKNGAYKLLSKLSLNKSYRATKKCLHKLFDNNFIGKILKKMKARFKRSLTPNAVMEQVGFKYLGVYDGHDLISLRNIFKQVKSRGDSVFIHLKTVKGKGYEPAEKNPELYHGIGKNFIANTNTFSNSISPILNTLVKEYPTLTAITAGMKLGTGLTDFASQNPNNFLDVGICEQYAVSSASGMAIGGLKPIVCVYSTFMQRAYDQIMVDVCMNNLPVIFLLDRAGLVGSDGRTHQGVFDLSYLKNLPNMTVLAPKDTAELESMLRYALSVATPVAIRYPNGEITEQFACVNSFTKAGEWEVLRDGNKVAVFAVGPRMISLANALSNSFEKGEVAVINARSVKPLDCENLNNFSDRLIVTLEENSLIGGFGESVAGYYQNAKINAKIRSFGVGDEFIAHASVESQMKKCGLTVENLQKTIKEDIKTV